MRAVLTIRPGAPLEALSIDEVQDPTLDRGDILIRLKAVGMNALDSWTRQGKPAPPRYPHILGSDMVGEIVDFGRTHRTLELGQRVLIDPCITCGVCTECTRGETAGCPQIKTLGLGLDGGYADLIAVPAENVLPCPEYLSDAEAAALPLVTQTGHHMLVTRGAVRPGEVVMIQGAGSGVGIATLQLAKILGARVIAIASSNAKCNLAKELGADEAINHSETDVRAAVLEMTKGRGVDLVIEHVGAATFESSYRSLARGGRIVSCGATVPGSFVLDLTDLFWNRRSIIGSKLGNKSNLRAGLDLINTHRVQPVLDKTFTLNEVVAAHEYFDTQRSFGKVVMTH